MNSVNRTVVTTAATALLALSVLTFLVITGTLDHRFPPWIPGPDAAQAAPAPRPDTEAPLPWPAPGPLRAAGVATAEDAWLEDELRSLGQLSAAQALMAAIACIATAGAAMVTVWMECRGENRRGVGAELLVSATPTAIATVEARSVRYLAEAAASGNVAVEHSMCGLHTKATSPPGGPQHIDISCRPTLTTGSSLPQVSRDLEERIRNTVQNSTGLVVEKVNIRGARFAPLPKGKLLNIPTTGGGR